MIHVRILLLSVLFCFKATFVTAQSTPTLTWKSYTQLPAQLTLGHQPGLAGAFTGVIGDYLFIAGGANFPFGMPWAGGKKTFWKDIYILSLSEQDSPQWIYNSTNNLPEPLAYGASVSIPDGIVCLGGENEKGISDQAFIIKQGKTINQPIVIQSLPTLPVPLRNHSAGLLGNTVFVIGGETTVGVSNHVYKLNLDASIPVWEQATMLPMALSHQVCIPVKQDGKDYLYMVGGRKKNDHSLTIFYNSLLCYDVEKNTWITKPGLPFALSAAVGAIWKQKYLVIVGGDRGEHFAKAETILLLIERANNKEEVEKLRGQLAALQSSHPGFSKTVLLYNLETSQWTTSSDLPFPPPVTTTAVNWKNYLIVPSGEVRAGIRTPTILLCH